MGLHHTEVTVLLSPVGGKAGFHGLITLVGVKVPTKGWLKGPSKKGSTTGLGEARGDHASQSSKGPRRRPAAAPRRLRRPSADVETRDSDPGVPGSRPLKGLTTESFKNLGAVYLSGARYYGRTVQIAGRFSTTRLEDGELYADLRVSGTKDDELLRVLSGTPTRVVQVHLCGEECGAVVTDPLLVHGRSFVEVDLRRLPWLTNLESVGLPEASPGVDELAMLRKRQEESSVEPAKERKKTPKKEKKRKRGEGLQDEEGRPGDPPSSKTEALEAGQKELKRSLAERGRNALGGRRKRRRRAPLGAPAKVEVPPPVQQRTWLRALLVSLTTRTSGEDLAQVPWRTDSGAVREARQSLMNQAGTLWNISRSELPPCSLNTADSRSLVPCRCHLR